MKAHLLGMIIFYECAVSLLFQTQINHLSNITESLVKCFSLCETTRK